MKKEIHVYVLKYYINYVHLVLYIIIVIYNNNNKKKGKNIFKRTKCNIGNLVAGVSHRDLCSLSCECNLAQLYLCEFSRNRVCQ